MTSSSMKLYRFVLILTFLCLMSQPYFAQQDKQQIMANFDFVTYYPDSTIKEAYTMVDLKVEGTMIEFDSLGKPAAIGQYKARKKVGAWIYPDGTSRIFKNGKDFGEIRPGCGTGMNLAREEFRKLYASLIE